LLAVETTSGGSVSIWLILAIIPVGAGMGLAVTSLIGLVLKTVPAADAGAASGMLATAQQMGNALGVAVVGTIFFAQLGSRSGAAAYGDAFSVAMVVQAVLALGSASLLTRAGAARTQDRRTTARTARVSSRARRPAAATRPDG
jgi:MFS family permease